MRIKTLDESSEAAMSFMQTQRTHVETGLYVKRYPDVDYMENIFVDTSAPDWAAIIAADSMDARGELAFLGPNSNDMNVVEVGYGRANKNIHTSALGYRYSIVEINEARYARRNLTQDRAAAVIKIVEQGLNKLAYVGNGAAKMEGLFNTTGVPTSTATGTLASLIAGATDIAGAQAIVTFFQNGINKVYVDQTNTTFSPTDIFLPTPQYLALASAILPFGGNMTLLQYLEANLVTGGNSRVSISPNINLKGTGASNKDRMVIYTKDNNIVKFHLPMPFRFLNIRNDSITSFIVPGMLRTGGTDIRVKNSMHYVDGV